MSNWRFENNVVCVKCNNFMTAASASDRMPASGSFIDMQGIDHGVFLVNIGTLDTAADFQVYQDTSATETSAIKVITGATANAGATDDNEWITVEFDVEQMDRANDFRYVTIVPSAGTGGNDYYCVDFLGFSSSKRPVTQNASYEEHVAV